MCCELCVGWMRVISLVLVVCLFCGVRFVGCCLIVGWLLLRFVHWLLRASCCLTIVACCLVGVDWWLRFVLWCDLLIIIGCFLLLVR